MQAIRINRNGGPDVLELETIADPTPGPGQLVVSTRFVGINPYEVLLREGKYPGPPLPMTPGHDAAGVVQAVGAGVTRFKVGDRVYTARTLSGAYAQSILCDASFVFALPANTSFEEGAALGVPYATAWYALRQRADARAGETVLIHGASGGVGTAAIQIAKAFNLTVIGTAGSPKGLELVREQGADHVLDHHDQNIEERIKALSNGAGVDVILEMLANVNLAKDLALLAKFGRVVVIGSRGPIEIDPRQAMGKNASILGMSLWNATNEEIHAIHQGIVAGLGEGSLKPVIGTIFPLSQAGAAQEEIMKPGSNGKILLDVLR